MESESGVGGLTYRYVYGLQKANVVISGIPNGAGSVMQYVYDDETGEFILTSEDPGQDVVRNSIVKLWYHQDRLGSTNFLTDNVQGKVTSFVSYDDWGAPTMKAILRMGVRALDLVTEYTGHPYDQVISLYFAEARMYDAADRRFTAMDAVKGNITQPYSLTQYVYVGNNPIKYVDLTGRFRNGQLLYNGNWWNTKADVKTLQTELNNYATELGFAKLSVNGKFNNLTEIALNKYKDKYLPGGNTGDMRGKVGYTTWLSLGLPIDMPNSIIELIPALLFSWDESEGIWCSELDVAQRPFGYNDIYNFFFQITDYLYFKSEFKYDGKEWMVQGWKGYYPSMGMGAEIGTYYRLPDGTDVNDDYFAEWNICLPEAIDHYWAVSNADMPYLEFKLYEGSVAGGKLIFAQTRQKHWWLNGFRPSIGNIDASTLTLEGAIYFETRPQADAFQVGLRTTDDSNKKIKDRFDNSNFKASAHSISSTFIDARRGNTTWYKVPFSWGKYNK